MRKWICARLSMAVLLAAALCVLPTGPACALDWSGLAQPVGTFVGNGANPEGVYAPATINAILGGSPPFDSGTSVTLIRLTRTQQYVRFYNPTDLANPSGAVGSWMMLASEVRGLTAAQVRDKFALPALPSNVVQVVVPTGYALYTGIAAPIAGWGDGGGLQNRAMNTKPPAGIAADGFLPAGSFVNAQALADAPVLSYRASASGASTVSGVSGASAVGAYMDTLAPRAGGDLEGVYNALDTLMFTGRSGEVGQAMAQFSPARFEALNTVALRTGALLAAALDARAQSLSGALAPGPQAGPPAGLDAGQGGEGERSALAYTGGVEDLAAVLPRLGSRQGRAGEWGLWLRGTGEYVRDNALDATPYSAATAAAHAGADRRVALGADEGLVLGLGAGLARTLLDWERDGGDSATTTVSLSAYGFWTGGEYFVNSDLTLDAAFTEARRRIKTAVTDRVARSSQSGEGASLRLRAGRRVALEQGWTVAPSVELGYGLHRQNAFAEHGAGDLGLDVRAATTQTLVAGAELALGRRLEQDGGAVLAPEAALGWRRETPLDSRVTRASFSGYSQSFQSYGDDAPRDSLLLRAGLAHRDTAGLTRFARYQGTLRSRFQAHGLELGCRWEF